MSDSNALPRFTNRLTHETNPSLCELAHNPVDWYAWNAEARAKAKREDKPIILSIGCVACHCGEMPSFMNLLYLFSAEGNGALLETRHSGARFAPVSGDFVSAGSYLPFKVPRHVARLCALYAQS